MTDAWAMEMANTLHDEGITDGKLAEVLGVTREYINKIRSGKKSASAVLTDKLEEWYMDVSNIVKPPTAASPSRQPTEAEYEPYNPYDTEVTEVHIPVWMKCITVAVGLLFICGCIAVGVTSGKNSTGSPASSSPASSNVPHMNNNDTGNVSTM